MISDYINLKAKIKRCLNTSLFENMDDETVDVSIKVYAETLETALDYAIMDFFKNINSETKVFNEEKLKEEFFDFNILEEKIKTVENNIKGLIEEK